MDPHNQRTPKPLWLTHFASLTLWHPLGFLHSVTLLWLNKGFTEWGETASIHSGTSSVPPGFSVPLHSVWRPYSWIQVLFCLVGTTTSNTQKHIDTWEKQPCFPSVQLRQGWRDSKSTVPWKQKQNIHKSINKWISSLRLACRTRLSNEDWPAILAELAKAYIFPTSVSKNPAKQSYSKTVQLLAQDKFDL